MSWYCSRFSLAGFVSFLLLSSTTTSWAREHGPNPTFTVLVYNNAEVSPKTLAKSAELAKIIFQNAGLDMVWMQFDPQQPVDRETMDKVELVLRILPEARSVLGPGATGEALPCSLGKVACFASVFFDRVKDKAQWGMLSQEQVLAHAIAHELGHLLLGSDSHFPIGLMRPKWGPEDLRAMAKGYLLFKSDQARLMKANLTSSMARKNPSTLSSKSSSRSSCFIRRQCLI